MPAPTCAGVLGITQAIGVPAGRCSATRAIGTPAHIETSTASGSEMGPQLVERCRCVLGLDQQDDNARSGHDRGRIVGHL